MKKNNLEYDWIKKWALYKPKGIAITDGDTKRSICYAELNQKANGLALLLNTKYGLNTGDRVAAISEFSIEYIILFAACQKSGIVLVPLNYRLALPELKDILLDGNPSLLFLDENFDKFNSLAVQIERFETIQNCASVTEYESTQIDEDSPIFILYTSGTTGKPKGVIYTHKMLFWNSINTALSLHINSDSTTVNVMPSFHTGGWNVLLTPFLHHGGHTVITKKFEPDEVIHALEKYKCSIFMAVPTMLAMLANSISFENADFSFLHYIIVGGEPMPIPLIKTYSQKGVAIRQGFGMTEVGPNLTSLHQDDAITKIGSIGRPNFYVKTRIVKENGKEALTNEIGELWISGPMVSPGYWKNDVETKKAFCEDGIWFKTGDILKSDEDQYLYVVDRLKNMFISGGENVYPAEIERILLQMDEVQECAVIGVNDDKWGEVGKAFIVIKADKTMDIDSIKAFCITKLAKFKVPKYIEIINELPKTDSGKIDRKALKK